MNYIIPRTCTKVRDSDSEQIDSRPLSDFRANHALVLLGDPGSGKTTVFQMECNDLGDAAHYVSARDFLTFNPENHPEWRDKILFIDGLDEVRAGERDRRTPFDEIRGRLDMLGKPSFRLSCRSTDWLGENDKTNLAAVAQGNSVTVVQLDSLGEPDVRLFLDAHPDVGAPSAFISEARERGVGGLLTNPQTLTMLVELVVDGGSWPESRRETFEMACLKLATEHNDEHRIIGQSTTVEKILDAAGRICAVQLIADVPGFATDQLSPDEEYIDPIRCDYEDDQMLRTALSSKLFTVDGDGRARPIHRQIAEFVGALHLGKVIESGLPNKRVISLMVGMDNLVVTGLRGLSAWLAVNCKTTRPVLIDSDPIGVGLYGDIHDFSVEDKYALLSSLRREVSRLNSLIDAAPAFAGLASHEMAPAIEMVLSEDDRNYDTESFVGFILTVLGLGQPLPELSEILIAIVHDNNRRESIAPLAAEAFINCCPDNYERTQRLREVLDSIHSGSIPDPDNELLGLVLANIYPEVVGPADLWDFMYDKGERNLIGSYVMFWDGHLLEKSSDDQVAELLEHLKERVDDLLPAIEKHHLTHVPLELLARDLQSRGEDMDIADLFELLSVCSALQLRSIRKEARIKVQSWLEQRPETHKAIILEGLSRCAESDRFAFDAHYEVYQRMFGARLPDDFGPWCLSQAVEAVSAMPQVAEHLLEQATRAYRVMPDNGGLSVDLLRSQTEGNEILKAKMDQLLSAHPEPPQHQAQEEPVTYDERDNENLQFLNHVRSQKEALLNNSAQPRLLDYIAGSYFGGFIGSDGIPGIQGVEEMFRADPSLVPIVLQALRDVVRRDDVPGVEEIFSLCERHQYHYLSWPFLAGLAEIEGADPELLSQLLDADRTRVALAFYYCMPHGMYKPDWFQRTLSEHPDIVAEIQVKSAIAELSGERKNIYGIWELAFSSSYSEVARIASLPILRKFPVNCPTDLSDSLGHLLLAAIQRADRASFESLVEEKVSTTEMDVAQRIRWLVAGLIVAPDSYVDPIKEFAAHSECRILHLAAMFKRRLPFDLNVKTVGVLIRIVGTPFGPELLVRDGWIPPEEHAAELVESLIYQLGGSPESAASETLDALIADPALANWQRRLAQARDEQRVVVRDASYLHPDPETICLTLNGSTPVSPGDLAALLVDRLEEISQRIRTGNTEDWQQYWNENSRGDPQYPKHEDHCRDALLSDLRHFLPDGVDAQPEGQYANDKRADIRAARSSDFNVPVEIKKNSHRDLWAALHNQLVEFYVSDPATGGFGIYLVFWFGPEHTVSAPPEGERPNSPDELKEVLQASLSPEQARKISVCVIDVSIA